MRRLICLTLAGVILGGAVAIAAPKQGKGSKHARHEKVTSADLPTPYKRGVLDGHAVIYSSRSNVIIDVAVLF